MHKPIILNSNLFALTASKSSAPCLSDQWLRTLAAERHVSVVNDCVLLLLSAMCQWSMIPYSCCWVTQNFSHFLALQATASGATIACYGCSDSTTLPIRLLYAMAWGTYIATWTGPRYPHALQPLTQSPMTTSRRHLELVSGGEAACTGNLMLKALVSWEWLHEAISWCLNGR